MAQEEISDFEELDLEKLLNTVTTASKHEQDISESPSAITVIDREQIENTHCTDVVCLLRRVPEVDVIRLKPMYAAVGARALTEIMGNKVLVLVDGWDINLESMGFPLWQALPVHLEDIERIEVVRGPGSALYGANAHSVVVSIITRKSGGSAAEVFIGNGEEDRSSLHLRLNQRLGDWSLRLSGGGDVAGNWTRKLSRVREVGRLRLGVGHKTGSSATELQLGLLTSEGEISSLLGTVNIRNGYSGDIQVLHRTEWFQARTWYTFYTADLPLGSNLVFQGIHMGRTPDEIPVFTHTLDAEAQIDWSPFGGNLLVVGGNYRWILVSSEKTDPEEASQHRVGFFIHDEQRLSKNLIITGGIRLDYNSITPLTLSPRLAGVWKFARSQSLRLAFGQAFRKPSYLETSAHIKDVDPTPGFEEIGVFMKNSIGNPDLENESITAFEAGYTGRFFDTRLSLEANAFYNRYRDTVNFHVYIATDEFGVPDLNQSEALFKNEGLEVDSVGGSLGVTYRLIRSLFLSANYTFRHSWYIADTPQGSQLEPVKKYDRVAWEPAHRFNLSFYHLLQNGLRWGLCVHAASSSDWDIIDAGIFGPVHHIHNPAGWMLSGFAGWRLDLGTGWVETGIRAYNFTDTPYQDAGTSFSDSGNQLGGYHLGRRMFFYLKGSL